MSGAIGRFLRRFFGSIARSWESELVGREVGVGGIVLGHELLQPTLQSDRLFEVLIGNGHVRRPLADGVVVVFEIDFRVEDVAPRFVLFVDADIPVPSAVTLAVVLVVLVPLVEL